VVLHLHLRLQARVIHRQSEFLKTLFPTEFMQVFTGAQRAPAQPTQRASPWVQTGGGVAEFFPKCTTPPSR
jgi:hypothetical protein